ncbi:hypothetical protein, partial [Brevibacterium picturae]|uniref:hypothetical protein n=1 Tax=Brevibacterium picturae TaxID=260553 RepID=UPI0031F9A410
PEACSRPAASDPNSYTPDWDEPLSDINRWISCQKFFQLPPSIYLRLEERCLPAWTPGFTQVSCMNRRDKLVGLCLIRRNHDTNL